MYTVGTKLIFEGFRCHIVFIHPVNQYLVVFDEDTKGFWACWPGRNKTIDGYLCDNNKFYWWLCSYDEMKLDSSVSSVAVAADHSYNCVECNLENKYAEANLTKDRYLCYSCGDSYAWKYVGQFSPNSRFYQKK